MISSDGSFLIRSKSHSLFYFRTWQQINLKQWRYKEWTYRERRREREKEREREGERGEAGRQRRMRELWLKSLVNKLGQWLFVEIPNACYNYYLKKVINDSWISKTFTYLTNKLIKYHLRSYLVNKRTLFELINSRGLKLWHFYKWLLVVEKKLLLLNKEWNINGPTNGAHSNNSIIPDFNAPSS